METGILIKKKNFYKKTIMDDDLGISNSQQDYSVVPLLKDARNVVDHINTTVQSMTNSTTKTVVRNLSGERISVKITKDNITVESTTQLYNLNLMQASWSVPDLFISKDGGEKIDISSLIWKDIPKNVDPWTNRISINLRTGRVKSAETLLPDFQTFIEEFIENLTTSSGDDLETLYDRALNNALDLSVQDPENSALV